jgi:rifampicin phosphotransferase
MSSSLVIPLILNLDSPQATLKQVGGKGASLARMAAAGLPVPVGFHVTTDAYRRFLEENHLGEGILAEVAGVNEQNTPDEASARIQSLIEACTMPGEIAAAIRQRYEELGAEVPVAVRSSATAEDLPDMSFAGQLETYLNVCGGNAVIDAVKRCWASLWTGRAIDYRQRQGIRSEDIGIAVVVQQLVPAQAAGVAFTVNPVTGSREELVINAAWGLGEAVVSGRVTPDTIVIDKRSGAIASQQIADKEVMTTRSSEGTREGLVPDDRRQQAVLEPGQTAELARLCARIEQLYGRPMDIEWALCDGRIYILQARPVTALPEAREALEWKVPREHARYFRTSVAEILPEPLSPLFATFALPAWNDATRQLIMASGIGFPPASIRLMTVHDYAYYEMALTPGQTARFLLGLPFRLPGIVKLTRSAYARWAEETRPRFASVTREWTGRDPAETPAQDLLTGARDLVEAAANYYVSVQRILGLANMSEAVFTCLYNRLIKRKSDPAAPTFLLGFDSMPIRAEKSLYDLGMWARDQGELADYLARTGSKDLAAAFPFQSEPIAAAASWQEFKSCLAEHLSRFGHAVYNLDFAKSVPAEDPSSQLETVKFFFAGQGRSPYERQAAGAAGREHATESMLARLGPLRRRLFMRSLLWAQRWAPMREESLADVGLGWPVLRRMLREVGRRMAAAGAIAGSDEIFWLKREEVEEAARRLDSGQPVDDYRPAIGERQRTWRSERGVAPPVALPVKGGTRIFGLDFGRWMPERTSREVGYFIRGVGASPGKVTARACVIHGPEEFGQMQAGCILVARITTPAWTPLFAMAAGIVTDVGGPLSHSSIVAREYGVPAVLGTGTATQRIRGGQNLTVDGDDGTVMLGV